MTDDYPRHARQSIHQSIPGPNAAHGGGAEEARLRRGRSLSHPPRRRRGCRGGYGARRAAPAQAYFWIINTAIISPYYDIEYNNGPAASFTFGDQKSALTLPSDQSYSSFALLPILNLVVRRRCLLVGGPGRGKTATAILMGILAGYSLNEAGPIAYSCPLGHGHHVLAHDLYVEMLDEEGRPVPPGRRGELTLTGGRNIFLPLLRYRTGDTGRLDFDPCPCGDPIPRILELEGRPPVLFHDAAGRVVNPVDLSRVLKHFPIVQHEFKQQADLSCELVIRPLSKDHQPDADTIAAALRTLLGDLPLAIHFDPALGAERPGGKVIPYQSALRLED